jgi:pilus assembly protein CpaB
MKTRAYVMLGLALLLAIASVFLAKNWIQGQVQPVAQFEQKPQVESVKIVVAASKLQYGNKLRREHLRLVDWPVSAVPEGSFRKIEDILGEEKTVGKDGKKVVKIKDRVVLRAIEINEPILTTKITGFGGRASLSTLITPGMRATTIRVNDVNGVAGFVLPGDRVDILLTRGGKRGGGKLTTDIMLQNMKVLGIDQDANEDRSKPAVVRAVTLEVTTIQAQKLTLAQKVGTLSLALRHVNTVGAEEPVTITVSDLKVGEANVAPDPLKTKAAESKVEAVPVAKPAVMKTVVKKKKNKINITIVRGLKAKEYEVQPEKPTFSAPAYSKPLNLLPSKLAPAVAPTPSLAPKLMPATLMPATLTPATPKLSTPSLSPAKPASGDGKSANDLKTTTLPSSSEPISLLKSSSNAGDDG